MNSNLCEADYISISISISKHKSVSLSGNHRESEGHMANRGISHNGERLSIVITEKRKDEANNNRQNNVAMGKTSGKRK